MTRMRDIDAVVLAGGRGTRLHPYTFSIPKPLVRLGEQPIIEILFHQLAACGVRRVHVALGHLADLMRAYLEQAGRRSPLEIHCSIEDEPLGTAGPIRLLRDLSATFLLLNGDVLTTLSYPALLDHHRRGGCVATVAVNRRQVELRYGIVDCSADGRVVGHREKPIVPLDVAMGIYVFERRIVDRVPPDRKFDVPDLIQTLIAAAEPIATYQSRDYWMDIGCADDYERAQRDFAVAPERFLGAPPRRV